MAVIAWTPTDVPVAGVAVVYLTPQTGDGNSVPWDATRRTGLWVDNGSGFNLTITIACPVAAGKQDVADRVIVMANLDNWWIWLNDPAYRQSNDTVLITWSVVTSVDVAVFKVPYGG